MKYWQTLIMLKARFSVELARLRKEYIYSIVGAHTVAYISFVYRDTHLQKIHLTE